MDENRRVLAQRVTGYASDAVLADYIDLLQGSHSSQYVLDG